MYPKTVIPKEAPITELPTIIELPKEATVMQPSNDLSFVDLSLRTNASFCSNTSFDWCCPKNDINFTEGCKF